MNKRLSLDDFIRNANNTHLNKYDYTNVTYCGYNVNINITCPDHGVFLQTPSNHIHGKGCPKCNGGVVLSHDECITNFIQTHGVFYQRPNDHKKGQGCPICNESKGERCVSNWLNIHNIQYIREFTYRDLLSDKGNPLRFDFYIPKYNICIEYDGEQHFTFKDGMMSLNEYNILKHHDNLKDEYCITNQIKLHRIRHDDDIDAMLQRIFILYNVHR